MPFSFALAQWAKSPNC